MSLNIKWLTNGKEKVYTVTDSLQETFDIYSVVEEIPIEIRYYAESIKEPTFCEPDLARFFGVQSIFYPDWPKPCGHPDYQGKICIAEMCKYGGPDKGWEKCQYFGRSETE